MEDHSAVSILTIEELQQFPLLDLVEKVFVNAIKSNDLVFVEDKDSDIEIYKKQRLVYYFKIINALAVRPVNRKSDDEEANKAKNPFSKNDPLLTVVENLLSTHKILLNKYPNIRDHFLMVTRDFIKQDTLLSIDELFTMFTILNNLNKSSNDRFFSFFNSGLQSGYSQIHKHIQFLSLPYYKDDDNDEKLVQFRTFFDDFIDASSDYNTDMVPLTFHDVAFKHFILPLPKLKIKITSKILLEIYNKLLISTLNFFKAKKIAKDEDELLTKQLELNPNISYNYIMTEEYMVIIPRIATNFNDCWANSLQFLGLFSARNEEVKQKILKIGFETYLSKVGFPNDKIDYYKL
ncbi:hypothetical protein PACTADRAFT_468 [Pachysolen tannophilus NRRL Y-2460]|uniref:Uncharacterized protein n=1 Tax=Pachysolen tannophilus NRRL Y-2460 TaxID=669874 RepID=A0A1E4U1U1_PACTA|nr:hypothetical protein PACTADRAFT_468 [Pachysolen tannophilus NRRL Y-2460]